MLIRLYALLSAFEPREEVGGLGATDKGVNAARWFERQFDSVAQPLGYVSDAAVGDDAAT